MVNNILTDHVTKNSHKPKSAGCSAPWSPSRSLQIPPGLNCVLHATCGASSNQSASLSLSSRNILPGRYKYLTISYLGDTNIWQYLTWEIQIFYNILPGRYKYFTISYLEDDNIQKYLIYLTWENITFYNILLFGNHPPLILELITTLNKNTRLGITSVTVPSTDRYTNREFRAVVTWLRKQSLHK